MVNVLNGHVETFKSKPEEFQLESMNGSVNMTVNAYTANRVTGDMRVFKWNQCKSRWPYLKNNDFPHSTKREIVDLLIGLDCAYLHSSIEVVRGKPSEPIARLTPLGWTCVGNKGQRWFNVANKLCRHVLCKRSVISREVECKFVKKSGSWRRTR